MPPGPRKWLESARKGWYSRFVTHSLPDASAVAAYRDALVPWYRATARDLPWRRDPTPYRVWVSEIMLQQTRVDTVLAYYDRFLARFPTAAALARASEEDVLEAWSGLGYYRRARALRVAAIAVEERHGGKFPRGGQAALDLPGIGRYTAGAIRSIAYGERAPILDGNVIRVLSRVFGIEGDAARAAVSRDLWSLAAAVVMRGDPSQVNQAQMELGALVCTPTAPACGECPLEALCVARRDGRVAELPMRPPKRATVKIARSVLLVRRGDRVLLRRRRESELLPGLWDLPGAFLGDDACPTASPETVAERLPFDVKWGASVGRLRHAVTYRRIALDVHEASAFGAVDAAKDRDGAELAWVPRADAVKRALSSPARRILKRWGSPA